jgi:hypothetical protein
LENPGGGIAPWNVQQFTFSKSGKKIIGKVKLTQEEFEVVFFHYHGLKFYSNNIIQLTGDIYEISKTIRTLFYYPYMHQLNKIKKAINKFISFDPHGSSGVSKFGPLTAWMYIKYYINDLKFTPSNLLGRSLKKRSLHHHFYKSEKF